MKNEKNYCWCGVLVLSLSACGSGGGGNYQFTQSWNPTSQVWVRYEGNDYWQDGSTIAQNTGDAQTLEIILHTGNYADSKIGFMTVAYNDWIVFDELEIYRAGVIAEWDSTGISSDKWFDKSGNDLHGTVTNAGVSVENAPSGDDGLVYETGSWTPSNSGGGGWTNGAGDTSTYVRVGNMVTLYIYLQLTDGTGADMKISGLPFTSASNNYTSSTNMNHGTNAAQFDSHYRLDGNATTMQLWRTDIGTNIYADNFNGTHQIFSITYRCA